MDQTTKYITDLHRFLGKCEFYNTQSKKNLAGLNHIKKEYEEIAYVNILKDDINPTNIVKLTHEVINRATNCFKEIGFTIDATNALNVLNNLSTHIFTIVYVTSADSSFSRQQKLLKYVLGNSYDNCQSHINLMEYKYHVEIDYI